MKPMTKKILIRSIIALIAFPIVLPILFTIALLVGGIVAEIINPNSEGWSWGDPSYQELELEIVIEYITDYSNLDIQDYDSLFTQREFTATLPTRINDYFAIQVDDNLTGQIVKDTSWSTLELDGEDARYERDIINYIITESNRSNELQLTLPEKVKHSYKVICEDGDVCEMYYDIEKEILYGKFHLG